MNGIPGPAAGAAAAAAIPGPAAGTLFEEGHVTPRRTLYTALP